MKRSLVGGTVTFFHQPDGDGGALYPREAVVEAEHADGTLDLAVRVHEDLVMNKRRVERAPQSSAPDQLRGRWTWQ